MFCCFPFLRRSRSRKQNDEKRLLVTDESKIIRYHTIVSIPYAHVLRDDKISIESSNNGEEIKNPTAYFLLDGTISDQDYGTDNLPCFAFDDAAVDTPIVLATRTTTGHILLERLYKIEHVTSGNSSTSFRMRPLSGNTVAMARPFDEFASDSAASDNPPSDNTTTKSD